MESNITAEQAAEQVNLLARLAHEVNREYCLAIGDNSQPLWDSAPAWQKESAIAGVMQHLQNPDMTPEQSHVAWYKHKLDEGWKYGPEKDPEKKEHPCMVPYAQLPAEQRAKDYLFRAAIKNGYLLMQHALDSAKERESQLRDQLEHAAEQRQLKDRQIEKLKAELAERKAVEQADRDTLAWLRVNGADLEALLKWWRQSPQRLGLAKIPEGVEGAHADPMQTTPSHQLVAQIRTRLEAVHQELMDGVPVEDIDDCLDDIEERLSILATRLAAFEAQSAEKKAIRPTEC